MYFCIELLILLLKLSEKNRERHNMDESKKYIKSIRHRGIVEDCFDGVAHVRIERASACMSCHAKSLCSIDKENQTVEVHTDRELAKGEEVEIEGRESLGLQAVAIAFVIPFVLLVAILFVGTRLGVSEVSAAIMSLGALALYYLVLLPLRKVMNRKFMFHVV